MSHSQQSFPGLIDPKRCGNQDHGLTEAEKQLGPPEQRLVSTLQSPVAGTGVFLQPHCALAPNTSHCPGLGAGVQEASWLGSNPAARTSLVKSPNLSAPQSPTGERRMSCCTGRQPCWMMCTWFSMHLVFAACLS